MPTPRRSISLLVHDAAGTTPVVTPRIARLERHAHQTRRCERCDCILARDNWEPYCSPCQRRSGHLGTHELYTTERPRR